MNQGIGEFFHWIDINWFVNCLCRHYIINGPSLGSSNQGGGGGIGSTVAPKTVPMFACFSLNAMVPNNP